MYTPHIYVIEPHTARIFFCAGAGTTDRAVRKALDYVIRFHALGLWLSIRHAVWGGSIQRPSLRILARSGRPRAVGERLDRSKRTGWRVAEGQYVSRTRQKRLPMEEIVCVLPNALDAAQIALKARYPHAWQRLEKRLFMRQRSLSEPPEEDGPFRLKDTLKARLAQSQSPRRHRATPP